MPSKLDILGNVTFGDRVAEEDQNLADYFVETDIWRRLLDGRVDVVYGAKGSGKSALYKQLLNKGEWFSSKQILLISAENLRGATVFKQVLTDTKLDQSSFRHLWFIYILTLIADKISDMESEQAVVKRFVAKLEEEGLLEGHGLRRILVNVRDYVTGFFRRVESIETSVSVDPTTQAPKVNGKITLNEPSKESRKLGSISVFDLVEMADEALSSLGLNVWITFDRLDVAFAENPDVEALALRTLFEVYNDFKNYSNIHLKIFIRDDIWKRISDQGFREGSHITKQVTITWSDQDLLYLLVSRIADNPDLVALVETDKAQVLSDTEQQRKLFYKVFPDKVDSGKNPETFNWMLGRCKDGLGITAPRELVHLMNEAKDKQVRALETGTLEISYPNFISRKALKDALEVVSKVRLEQTIYAEYPQLKPYIQKLKDQKTEQNLITLSSIFGTTHEETQRIVEQLVSIGFFVETGETFWTPFLYRGGLSMSQGREDEGEGR